MLPDVDWFCVGLAAIIVAEVAEGELELSEVLLAWRRDCQCQGNNRCACRELLLEERERRLQLVFERER